ncbi:MAG: hypothetical protein AAF632_09725 [Bacteroidota bacterium]
MKKYLIIKLVILSLTYGCSSEEELIEPKNSFTRIYETQEFSDRYEPLAIVQTSDSGYLTLSKTEQWRAHLFKSDEEGMSQWEMTMEEPFVSPLPHLFPQDSGFLMFGMNELSQSMEVYAVNPTAGTVNKINTIGNIQYPLAAHRTTDNNWIFLGYDRENRSSTLHSHTSAFTEIWSESYSAEEDVEEYIIDHIAGVGSSLPFFVGTNGNFVYFNGFYNYSFSLVFANAGNGEIAGTMYGYRNESTISALYPTATEQYALSQNKFGRGALLSNASILEQSIAVGSDLPVVDFNEIDENARVIIKEINYAGREIILYGTQTKRRQLVFYAYAKDSGELISINYLGQTNPYLLGDFTVTGDGGLVVAAETYLAGRFSRLQLFKLSKQEFSGWF